MRSLIELGYEIPRDPLAQLMVCTANSKLAPNYDVVSVVPGADGAINVRPGLAVRDIYGFKGWWDPRPKSWHLA